MNGLRTATLVIAGFASVMVLHLSRASAQWWYRAPADFEECTATAENSPNKQDKSAALAECNAKFAGRRKPGGGYTYYDFMQDRSFDIAGPNPTPQEQHYIDEQYTAYLARQRRSNVATAYAKQQQMELEQAPLRSETTEKTTESTEKSTKKTTEKIPMPQKRPKVLQQADDARAHGRNCPQHNFSCEWSNSLDGLKKLFNSNASSKSKKS